MTLYSGILNDNWRQLLKRQKKKDWWASSPSSFRKAVKAFEKRAPSLSRSPNEKLTRLSKSFSLQSIKKRPRIEPKICSQACGHLKASEVKAEKKFLFPFFNSSFSPRVRKRDCNLWPEKRSRNTKKRASLTEKFHWSTHTKLLVKH